MDPFETLQLSPGASQGEVKAAYHLLAKQWHPDKFSGAEKQAAEEKFMKISQAYAAIKKGGATISMAGSPAPPPSQEAPPAEKTPRGWLAEAKAALDSKQFDAALSLSQYCFNFPEVSEEARLVYAKAIESTSKDIKAQARAFEEVLRVNPNNKESLLKLAELYLALNMPARSASVSAKAKALAAAKPGQAQAAGAQGNHGLVNRMFGFFKES
jgi:tetratricopeptide (TPR) repeat protein